VKRGAVIAAAFALGLVGTAGYLLGGRSASTVADTPAVGTASNSAKAAQPRELSPSRSISPAAPGSRGAVPPGAPLPPVNEPVAGLVDELKKQAAAGSSPAACRLAFELDRCHNVQRLQRNAANFANLANQPGTGPDLARRYSGFAEREQAKAFEVQRLCLGVPRAETGDAWRYLLQAARAGHGPSMARYANRHTLWEEDPIRVLDGLIAFRAEGPAFLQGAAQMGYAEAYEQLAFAHTSGPALGLDIPTDRVKGIAYYLALMRTGTPDEVARLQRAVDYAMQKDNLSQDDLARARQISEPLAAPLLRRYAPGSVDFTGGTYAADNGAHCEK
jgi:hypothetical protein